MSDEFDFGPEHSGTRLAQRDMMEMAHSASQTENQLSQAYYHNVQAEKGQVELRAERAVAEDLARQAGGQTATPGAPALPGSIPTNPLWGAAQTYIRSGAVTKGAEIAAKASLIDQRQATTKSAEAAATLRAVREHAEEANQFSRLMGWVQESENPADAWAQANLIYTQRFGRPSPYAGSPYSPEVVEALKQSGISAHNQAQLMEREYMDSVNENYKERRLEQLDADRAIRQQRADAYVNYLDYKQKNGGAKNNKPLTVSKDDREQATSLINKDFPGMEAEDKYIAANTVASLASELQRANPALNKQMALQQAYDQERSNFQTGPGRSILGVEVGKGKTTFGNGATSASPATLPGDTKSLKEGRWYRNKAGVIAKWTGSGFLPAGSTGGLSPDNTDEDDDAEDNE